MSEKSRKKVFYILMAVACLSVMIPFPIKTPKQSFYGTTITHFRGKSKQKFGKFVRLGHW